MRWRREPRNNPALRAKIEGPDETRWRSRRVSEVNNYQRLYFSEDARVFVREGREAGVRLQLVKLALEVLSQQFLFGAVQPAVKVAGACRESLALPVRSSQHI